MNKLPHTDPILFVTTHNIISDKEISAEYTVPADHPVLKGHFPHISIWPGIHLIEGMNQTAGLHALYLASTADKDLQSNVTFVTSIDSAKFRSPVFPGAKLQYHATLVKRKRNHVFYQCEVYSNTVKCAEAVVGLTAR